MTEIREKFNSYINNDAPKQLEKLFDRLDENDGIMLQSCFEDFAEMILEQSPERVSVDAIVMWRPADEPPKGNKGKWTDDVVAVTNFGNVYSIAFYHGMNGGNWQRLSAFEKGEEVYKWCVKPLAT